MDILLIIATLIAAGFIFYLAIIVTCVAVWLIVMGVSFMYYGGVIAYSKFPQFMKDWGLQVITFAGVIYVCATLWWW